MNQQDVENLHAEAEGFPRYPSITVPLSGEDGNVFAIISRTRQALRRGGVPASEIGIFSQEAVAGDYDNALQTVMRWAETT